MTTMFCFICVSFVLAACVFRRQVIIDLVFAGSNEARSSIEKIKKDRRGTKKVKRMTKIKIISLLRPLASFLNDNRRQVRFFYRSREIFERSSAAAVIWVFQFSMNV